MKTFGDLLTRHKNTFLMALLAATLVLGSQTGNDQARATTVDIPVTETAAEALSDLESFRQQRDQAIRADIAALERLIAQETLDEPTRQQAADMLQEIVGKRQLQTSIEGALSGSSLYPCAAVYQGGILTLVTEKDTVTERDTALVMTLAAEHGGIAPEDVRIICGK